MIEYELFAENDQYIAYKKSKYILVVNDKKKDMEITMDMRRPITIDDLESALRFFTTTIDQKSNTEKEDTDHE
mgnify:CR=1 FL=1